MPSIPGSSPFSLIRDALCPERGELRHGDPCWVQEKDMKSIRWGWILLGGSLAELAIFVVVLPLSLLAGR